jgi:hypothetical protein
MALFISKEHWHPNPSFRIVFRHVTGKGGSFAAARSLSEILPSFLPLFATPSVALLLAPSHVPLFGFHIISLLCVPFICLPFDF